MAPFLLNISLMEQQDKKTLKRLYDKMTPFVEVLDQMNTRIQATPVGEDDDWDPVPEQLDTMVSHFFKSYYLLEEYRLFQD